MDKTLAQLRGETETTVAAVTTNDNTTHSRPTFPDASFNWQLTLGKHGITVDTSIKSYGDLLKQMKLWQQACQSPSIGRSPSSPSGMVVLRRQLPLWLFRRGHFMAITICVKAQQMKSDDDHPLSPSLLKYEDDDADLSRQQQPSPPLSDHDTMKHEDAPDRFPPMTITTFRFADSRDQICRQILDTFFACYHVHFTILHQPTFYRLFVNTSPSLMHSPVVNAVCALALTVRCRHMQHLVPYQDQADVAMMFFNRARHLVAFDEPTLGSFIVFTFLAMYKQMIFSVADASFYLDIAFRTRCLLIDDGDDGGGGQDGEREMIKRLHWALWEVQTSLEYYNNQRGVPVSTTTTRTGKLPHHPIIKLMREKRHQYTRHALPDEPPAIQESLQMAFYRAELMQAQGSFLRRVRFDVDDTIDLKYLAETDYRFTKCYHDLPSDYRIDATLFEISDDLTFRQRLDCISGGAFRKTAALNLALQYYQGIISLYEPFLPNLKERERAQVLGLLKEDGDTPSMGPTTTPTATSTADDRPMDLTMHHRHAQEKCTEAATNIMRLLDYQRSLPSYCSVNMHILLTAWDIHMRNACLGLAVNGNTMYFGCLSGNTILEARQCLLQCFSVLREGYLFNFAEHAIWRYYEHVERQLLDSFPMTPPSTASYWIPYGL